MDYERAGKRYRLELKGGGLSVLDLELWQEERWLIGPTGFEWTLDELEIPESIRTVICPILRRHGISIPETP